MLTSEQGFTLIESLIALAIVGILLTGICNLSISSSQAYIAQNTIVQMQADGRAAMEFIVREMRHISGNPTISTTNTSNDTIRFNRVEDIGYATEGTPTTLTDDTKEKIWQSGAFSPSSSSTFTVTIVNGMGSGQARSITGNSDTELTISQAWGVTPDTSSRYIITSDKSFSRSSENYLRYRIGATGDFNQLSENITNLSFSQPDLNTITINLTARTKAIDPIKKQYRTYTLTQTVRRRN
jgi:prepilin-type N-terminal cleavage/methylation domain-containing protein